jgi:hypothetical protein
VVPTEPCGPFLPQFTGRRRFSGSPVGGRLRLRQALHRVSERWRQRYQSHRRLGRNQQRKRRQRRNSRRGLDQTQTTPALDAGKYEAEQATLNICTASGDNAASGFSQVTGLSPSASATFANVKAGTSLDVVYCTMNNPAQLTLYINGTKSQSISFPTTGSWSTTYATKKVTVTIPPGCNAQAPSRRRRRGRQPRLHPSQLSEPASRQPAQRERQEGGKVCL